VVPGGGHFAGYILGREVLDWIGDVWGDRKHGRTVGVVHSIAEHESHRP
jgi:hypothetical protein